MQRNKKKPYKKKVNTKEEFKEKKSQAALDYLMSWGWVLIIIVLVLVILFSLGVFRVPTAPTIISGFKGITMQAAEANSTMMVVKVINNYNQPINITGITVSINGNTYTTFYCMNSIISTGQSTLCRMPLSIPTSSYLSKIQISFTPYKSSIYEVSNGTVSSTLVSGAIPINNQLTYFIEKGLPYGSTFTVNYNTSTNSTTVSSTKQNVSFNLPFGNYYFSVPSITYQGCVSKPLPAAGYHSTGVEEVIAFTSNCTTTFSETGLPSNQYWQVSYNGTTKSNSTGSAIVIKTDNVTNAQVYYTAIAKSGNLACVSYKTPSVELGGSYTFSAWNCTTTFSETGLPSNQDWKITSYDGLSSSAVSTGSLISITQDGITTVSTYSASSGDTVVDCNSNPDISVMQGSSGTFTTWQCTTTFSETGLPSNQYWQVSYNGTTNSNVPTGSSTKITDNNVKNADVSYTASAKSDSLSCVSYATPSIELGGSYTFSAWNCTTTFSETGLPSGQNWYSTYDGQTSPKASTGSPTSITQDDITTVSSYTGEGYSSNLNCNSYNTPSVLQGSSSGFSAWNCTTTFSETGIPLGATGDGISGKLGWTAYYPANTAVNSSTSSSTLTYKQDNLSQITESAAGAGTNGLTCGGSTQYTIYSGGSASFTSWDCITSFHASQLEPGTTWNITSSGKSLVEAPVSSSTDASISYRQNGLADISTQSFDAVDNQLDCSVPPNTVYQGGSTSFSPSAWTCTTTITFFGVSSPCPSDESVDTGCNTSPEEFSFNWSSASSNYHYNMIFPVGYSQVSKTITTHFMSGAYHYCTGGYGNNGCTGDFNYNYNSPVNNSIVNCLYNRDYLRKTLDTDGGSDILGFSNPVIWTGNTSVAVSFVPGIPQFFSDSLNQDAGCVGWDGQDYSAGDTNGN